jgi:hypothetical protein
MDGTALRFRLRKKAPVRQRGKYQLEVVVSTTRSEKADNHEIWTRLAAPVPEEAISWRQDGQVVQRGDRYIARFVAYVDASTVRSRLDEVVPGEWNLSLEPLPTLQGGDNDEHRCAFKARLEIRGVVREDVGIGRDYKSASTDAFKRAAVRFGIAHELYSYERNWVEMDGDSKYAQPKEDPALAYARRMARAADATQWDELSSDEELEEQSSPMLGNGVRSSSSPSCPKCGGRMWDNRATKRNPRAPDFKCRSRACDGVVWPERATEAQPAA